MTKKSPASDRGLIYDDPVSEWADRTGPNPHLRDIHFGERRSGGDRRKNDGSGSGLRANEVDGRSVKDRRLLRIGISIRTDSAVEALADWLESNCFGKWSMVLSDISRHQGPQEMNVMFERRNDADLFIRFIASGRGELV